MQKGFTWNILWNHDYAQKFVQMKIFYWLKSLGQNALSYILKHLK